MKQAYLLLTILIIFAQDARALYRHNYAQGAESAAHQPAANQVQLYQTIATSLPGTEAERHFSPKRHVNPDDRYRSTIEGTVSIVCALFSLLCFVAASAASFPLFLIPAFVFAAGATVFGAIGIRRHKRGFAILGLALGLLEIIGGFFIVAQL